jgi:hypothetical protein
VDVIRVSGTSTSHARVPHRLRDLRIGAAQGDRDLHTEVISDIQDAGDAVRRVLRRQLCGIARHGTGQGDHALVDGYPDGGVIHT